MIGIAYTIHNRNEMAINSVLECYRQTRLQTKIVIVDDASDIPIPGADYRFDQNVGIATAKNKCLELLEGCEHIFLFDDDIYPTQNYWWESYTDSGFNHMCFTFGRSEVARTPVYVSYAQPCGLMIYLRRECINKVGGFDTDYIKWGGEHQDLSQRIYNAGLTPYPFIDVPHSLELFYSHDYHGNVQSSVFDYERMEYIPNNMQLLQKNKLSKEFKAYK